MPNPERPWTTITELADLLDRAAARRAQVAVTADTARLIALYLRAAKAGSADVDGHLLAEIRALTSSRRGRGVWDVSLYADGSSVYQVDESGDLLSIEAWARNTSVAQAAFDVLREKRPGDRFEQRRRSWVERD